ncbi:hypothetical protein EVAR_4688_1 [Eumeta japonica]|uniref:Uncharacterized protein n=1 Tax=Eumeta variegata TaxID=151549 RepID=A0A4C1WQL2_EUMVA|nr:hypothetical protein EVAR_4688_1 [Eumeta japonica]
MFKQLKIDSREPKNYIFRASAKLRQINPLVSDVVVVLVTPTSSDISSLRPALGQRGGLNVRMLLSMTKDCHMFSAQIPYEELRLYLKRQRFDCDQDKGVRIPRNCNQDVFVWRQVRRWRLVSSKVLFKWENANLLTDVALRLGSALFGTPGDNQTEPKSVHLE